MTIDLDVIDRDTASIRCIESTEEMKKRALAAARRTAESYCLSFIGFEVDAFQDSEGSLIIALPHVFGA